MGKTAATLRLYLESYRHDYDSSFICIISFLTVVDVWLFIVYRQVEMVKLMIALAIYITIQYGSALYRNIVRRNIIF